MEIKHGNVGKWLVPTCVRIPLCTHCFRRTEQFLLLPLIPWLTSTFSRGALGKVPCRQRLTAHLVCFAAYVEWRGKGWSLAGATWSATGVSLSPAVSQPLEDPGVLKHPDLCFTFSPCLRASCSVYVATPVMQSAALAFLLHLCLFPFLWMPSILPSKDEREKRIVCCVDCKSPRLLGSCLVLVDYVEKNYSQ